MEISCRKDEYRRMETQWNHPRPMPWDSRPWFQWPETSSSFCRLPPRKTGDGHDVTWYDMIWHDVTRIVGRATEKVRYVFCCFSARRFFRKRRTGRNERRRNSKPSSKPLSRCTKSVQFSRHLPQILSMNAFRMRQLIVCTQTCGFGQNLTEHAFWGKRQLFRNGG